MTLSLKLPRSRAIVSTPKKNTPRNTLRYFVLAAQNPVAIVVAGVIPAGMQE